MWSFCKYLADGIVGGGVVGHARALQDKTVGVEVVSRGEFLAKAALQQRGAVLDLGRQDRNELSMFNG